MADAAYDADHLRQAIAAKAPSSPNDEARSELQACDQPVGNINGRACNFAMCCGTLQNEAKML